jgi:hypothetical protein
VRLYAGSALVKSWGGRPSESEQAPVISAHDASPPHLLAQGQVLHLAGAGGGDDRPGHRVPGARRAPGGFGQHAVLAEPSEVVNADDLQPADRDRARLVQHERIHLAEAFQEPLLRFVAFGESVGRR